MSVCVYIKILLCVNIGLTGKIEENISIKIIFMITFGTSPVCQVWPVAPSGSALQRGGGSRLLSRIYFLFYFIWNTETFKNRDTLTIYMYCTVSDTFSLFKSDIPSYGRPKTLQVSAIFNSHLTKWLFGGKCFCILHTFSLSRFTCTIVCLWDGKAWVPSVEVTDLVATFCSFKPWVKNLCNRVSSIFFFLVFALPNYFSTL